MTYRLVLCLLVLAALPLPVAADEPPPGYRLLQDEIREFGPITVTLDFARVLRLEEPARTVIVGNPGILDATVSDERTLVLTGRSAGATNLIALDAAGQEIANLVVRVATPGSYMSVHHGAERQTYHCSIACTAVLAVGDGDAHFNRTRGQIGARQDFSRPPSGTVPR